MIDNEYKKLSEITSITVGYPIRGSVSEVRGTGVFVVQLKDVSVEKSIVWHSCIETELTGKKKPDWILPGDILFSSRGRNNHAVLVEQIPDSIKVVASPHFFVVRLKHDSVIPGYLSWLLNQPPCQRHIKRQAEGTLTQSVRRSVVEDIPVTLPSIQNQETIVKLSKSIKQEKKIFKQLIQKGEKTMNAIANDLFAKDKTE